jgi:hypothetical protein
MRMRAGLLAVLAAVLGTQGWVAHSSAAVGQEASLQDDRLLIADPAGTLDELRRLGVQRVRVFVPWAGIAPRPLSAVPPPAFDAPDPLQYPAANWSRWDTIVRDATARGIGVDLTLTGPVPLWATGPGGRGPRGAWDPSARRFGDFVRAIGARYDGGYTPPGASAPLPRVDDWGIWNEPNYGPHLAPQAWPGAKVEYSPRLYRSLLDAAWSALAATGHGRDTIVFGELSPRGNSFLGVFSGTKPLRFLRELYCLDSSFRPLRGAVAVALSCPTTAPGTQRFRARHPALVAASGLADHPYLQGSAPNLEPSSDPDYSSLPRLPQLERTLDRAQRSYGSSHRLPLYLTEFGYITSPPRPRGYVTPALAAYFLNWAEYIAWSDPRVMAFNQYLLADPMPGNRSHAYGGFASGLSFYRGTHKPSYDAYRLPLYLPVTVTAPGRGLEVWGCARPAVFAWLDAPSIPEQVAIQFRPAQATTFATISTITVTSPRGYFDQRVLFPGPGSVRLAWSDLDGRLIFSRVQAITLDPRAPHVSTRLR